MAKPKPTASKAPKLVRKTLRARVSNGKEVRAPAAGASHERGHKPAAPRASIDAAHFGKPGPGATHFTMAKIAASGERERLRVAGRDGVAVEHFPLKMLSVENLRHTWGPGTFHGQWMKIDAGRWTGCGRMREVTILQVAANGAAAPPRRVGAPPQAFDSFNSSWREPQPAAAPTTEPGEVVDLRVRAERDIAAQRLAFEREMSDRRLQVEREDNERRFNELRDEIESVRRGQRDDDDEPGQWDWLGPLIEKLRPTIESLLPQVLSNLAKTKGLPS